MVKILGYGEDALTLWAMKEHIGEILKEFEDPTLTSDCLVFYRPSFGRSGGEGSAEFGEFDAIIASRKNIYLIESKWDNLSNNKKEELSLSEEQLVRHEVLTWYLTYWNKTYVGKWQKFVDGNIWYFTVKKKLPENKKTLLLVNLESILFRLLEHCKEFATSNNVKNILLYFHNGIKSKPPKRVNGKFVLISIDYSKAIEDNRVPL